MTAIVEPIISGQTVLPVCLDLLDENSHRLVSLWEIMNLANLFRRAPRQTSE